MKNKIAFFILVSGVLFSCKKDYPAPQNGTPVFTASGTINGAPVNLNAGTNNYYMFTSYSTDGNGVRNFTGELKDYNCTSGCANALKFTIKDYRQFAVLPTDIDSSIFPAYYSFATPLGKASMFDVTFDDTMMSGTALSRQWNFGDGTTGTLPNSPHRYFHPGIYSVSLNTQSTTSCSSSITNNVLIGQTGDSFLALFTTTSTVGNTVSFNCPVSGLTYNWNFGDGSPAATVQAPSHTFPASGVYQVSLTATNTTTGYSDTHTLNIPTQTNTSCYNSFFLPSININPVANPMNLADVIVEWRDASGTLWTSNDNSQSAISMFKIISVNAYANNTNGEPVKKISAKISCMLYNGTNTISVDAYVVFAVAYP